MRDMPKSHTSNQRKWYKMRKIHFKRLVVVICMQRFDHLSYNFRNLIILYYVHDDSDSDEDTKGTL